MPPAEQILSQAHPSRASLRSLLRRSRPDSPRTRHIGASSGALAIGLAFAIPAFVAPGSARAQDLSTRPQEVSTPTTKPVEPITPPTLAQSPSQPDAAPVPDKTPANSAAADDQGQPVDFQADTVQYDDNNQVVTATGNVILSRENKPGRQQSVRSDVVTYNRQSGQIIATGDVRIVDEDGNQTYTDRADLTDKLQAGTMENLLVVMRQSGRLAAQKGERLANGDMVLTQAAYTGCDVVDDDGCPKKPSWRVVARQVLYSDDKQQIRFRNAHLELFGIVQLPLAALTVSTNGQAVSGFLVPDVGYSSSNGFEFAAPYYYRIAPNQDVTGTLYGYTKSAPMASLQYRALTDVGAFQITGYATSSTKIPVSSTDTTTSDTNSQKAFRGYIFANGAFQLNENWSVTASIRGATDRTFLRRYYISSDDRLRSTVNVERIDQDSYFSLAGYVTQTMQSGTEQGTIPVALPVLDYRRRFADPLLGGTFQFEANSLGISRKEGQDTQRAFASGQWTLTKLTPFGQQVTFTGLVRGDIYHSDENDETSTLIYQGLPGWEGRVFGTAAIDVKWPLVGQFAGGTQVLTPRIQFVATPHTKNMEIPNEDSRAIELDTGNLFALDRYPGYDRIEDGARVTYGFDWQFERPRWRITSTVGQSVRLTRDNSDIPDGTGLYGTVSDIVARTEIRYRDFINFTHRIRIDKDNGAVRRNEIDATIGNTHSYLEVGYTKLNRNISDEIEDLQDRQELRAAGRIAFAHYWSLFGSTVVNMTSRADDPTYGSDGFQPLRTRVGVAYEDDCLEVALTWRRDYQTTGDAKGGDSFQLHFALKNIGRH